MRYEEFKEAVLHHRDFEYDGKGPVKITKQKYARVQKDSKLTSNGKPYMMVLNPKTQGTELVPVQFVDEAVMTEEQFDEAAGEKDACYHKVKSRYKVWPSAYASGALVQCRKVGAANWGNKSKK